MEQSTAYLVMLLSPIIPCLFKLGVSYRIRYKTPKLNVEKYYKKNKKNFLRKFFFLDLRQRIHPIIYFANYLLGVILMVFVSLSVIYAFLWLFRYELRFFVIPQVTSYISLILATLLMIVGTLERWYECSWHSSDGKLK